MPPAPPSPQRLIHVQPPAAATANTAAPPRCFLQHPTSPNELLPPLHLTSPTSTGPPAAPSTLLTTLAHTPFWLDPVLSFLPPDAWLRLEVTCHRLLYFIPKAEGAWRTLDLGPAWASVSPHRKRAEVIARRSAIARVRRAWEGIEAFALPGLKWTLNPGLAEQEVRRLEVRFLVCLLGVLALYVLKGMRDA